MSKAWCGVVVLAAAAVLTAQGGSVRTARQATRQCAKGEECVSLRVCRPLQDIIAKGGPTAEQTVRAALCGGGRGRDLRVCCPEAGGSTRPVFFPTPTPPKVNGEDLLPKGTKCGQTINERVVHGDNAPLYAYAWMALLGYQDAANPEWHCGGALINDRYILTAAHCVHRNFTNSLGQVVAVRLGELNTATDPDCPSANGHGCAPSPQNFVPEEIIVHQTFNARGPVSDDIALIRLNKKAVLGQSVHPICVPPAGLNVPDFLGPRDATVAGWGATETKPSSDILQVADIPFANKTICETFYPRQLVEEQVCFGGRGKKDSCFGDSGGPIFQTDKFLPRFTVLGIVSRGLPACGIPGAPAVYTNVAHYRKWITDNLKP